MADDPLVDDDILATEDTPGNDQALSNQVQIIRSSRQYNLALLSLIGMLLFAGALLFFVDITKIGALDTAIGWLFAGLSSIVLGYFGFNAYSYIKNPHVPRR